MFTGVYILSGAVAKPTPPLLLRRFVIVPAAIHLLSLLKVVLLNSQSTSRTADRIILEEASMFRCTL